MPIEKSREEIIYFLNNCYSKEKAYIFFHIKQNMSRACKNKELQKICEQYSFNINELNRSSYIKRQKELYYQNPKHCLYCGKIIPFEKRSESKFCNSSCAASYNNKLRAPRTDESKKKTSDTLKKYGYINGKLIKMVDGSYQKISQLVAARLYYEGKIDYDTIKQNFPKLIRICPVCNKEFVRRPMTNSTGYLSFSKTCSDECHKQLRIDISKETYIKVKETGRFKGWTTRNISSYAEKFWEKVLDNNSISYIREFHFVKYFLDFRIEIGDIILDLEIDGKQHTYEDRKLHDKQRDQFLTENGFTVYRISWNKITNDVGKKQMQDKINKFLEFYNSLKEQQNIK